MTSRGSDEHPNTGFAGHVRIHPALNETESVHLSVLVDSDGTLRGTPTGRGDRAVPFARLGWEVCSGGCCLTWNPNLELSEMMRPTLQFLIDHLLRRGAKAEGRAGFGGFTFDHVLKGAVMGGCVWDVERRLIEVAGNVVTERLLPPPCGVEMAHSGTRSTGRTRRGPLPANVIEFRPRRPRRA